MLGIGRNQAYEAAKRGEIPTIALGNRKLVPKATFHRMLGLTEPLLDPMPEMVVETADTPTPAARSATPARKRGRPPKTAAVAPRQNERAASPARKTPTGGRGAAPQRRAPLAALERER
jgi:hypothetical protein